MTECPLGCGPLTPGEWLRDNRFGLEGRYRLAWCRICGLGVTLDAPAQHELDSLYTDCYLAFEKPQLPRTGRAAHLWRLVNGSSPLVDAAFASPVLDVGCNRGELLAILRRRGIDGVGLEPNPAAARAARELDLVVIESPIESATLPQREFGSIIASQVLEHVHDPEAVLARLHGALADDGTLYVVVPNVGSIWRRVFGQDWVHWHVPFHLWHHTRQSLALLLAHSGFRVTSMRTITPGEWLLMSLQTRSNARHGSYELESFQGRFGRRLALAPLARLADSIRRGDALYIRAVKSSTAQGAADRA